MSLCCIHSEVLLFCWKAKKKSARGKKVPEREKNPPCFENWDHVSALAIPEYLHVNFSISTSWQISLIHSIWTHPGSRAAQLPHPGDWAGIHHDFRRHCQSTNTFPLSRNHESMCKRIFSIFITRQPWPFWAQASEEINPQLQRRWPPSECTFVWETKSPNCILSNPSSQLLFPLTWSSFFTPPKCQSIQGFVLHPICQSLSALLTASFG